MFRKVYRSLRAAFRLKTIQDDLDEELQFHVEMQTREFIRRGLDAVEARRAALRAFGGFQQLKEEVRDVKGVGMIEALGCDVRFGIRTLLQNKGWTAVIVLSLAIGIGANTAVFSGINGLYLRSIPVSNPDELVRFRSVGKNDMGTDFEDYGPSFRAPSGPPLRNTFPYAVYLAFRNNNQTLSGLAAGAPKGLLNVIVDGSAETARGYVASGNFYQVLAVSAVVGRTILPDDDRPSAPPVAVISAGYWKRRFGGASDIVGRTIQVNNAPVTIVGVTNDRFAGIQQTAGSAPDITLPLAVDPKLDNTGELLSPTTWWLQVMGRVKPGVNAAQVQGNLEGVFQATARSGWDSYFSGLSEAQRQAASNQNHTSVPHLAVDSGSHGIYDAGDDAAQSAKILSTIVTVLLLIVCANIANLLLSRSAARQKEISVRLSLGATRGRLVRQLLTEAILLSCIGGLAGLAAGYGARSLLPGGLSETPFDWRLFGFVAALTLLTGVLFGIMPALRATTPDLNGPLKESGRSVIRSRSKLSKSLLVIQVAMSLTLLIGAGLLLGTLRNLRSVDIGFNPENLTVFAINPQLDGYDQARSLAFDSALAQQLQSAPGVEAVSYSQPALLSGSISSTDIYIEGHAYSNPRGDGIDQVRISPDFFRTLGIPLLAGRVFTARDDATAPKVAIINQAAARRFFGAESPLGSHFGQAIEKRGDYEIVGVVRDTKYNSLREDAPPTVYFAHPQRFTGNVYFEVRSAGALAGASAAIRDAVRRVDPSLPLISLNTQAERIEGRMSQEKLFAQAYMLFGAIALALASTGLFGLMSYNVARRTGEIGIRMALGAQRVNVLVLVMRESMTLVAVGVVLGLGGAAAARRLIRGLLFGLTAADPLTIVFAIALLVAVSALAAYLPARRASGVDPMTALHYE